MLDQLTEGEVMSMMFAGAQNLTTKWQDRIAIVNECLGKKDPVRDIQLAIVLENVDSYHNATMRNIGTQALTETTQMTSTGYPYKFHDFDLVTAVFPNLIAQDLVSVQTLNARVGQLFYLKYQYGSNKGGVTLGSTMTSPFVIGNPDDFYYTSDTIPAEAVGASGTDTQSFTLAWLPVRPGTVTITATKSGGTLSVTDDGEGGWSGTDAVSGAIDYATGVCTLVFAAATTSVPSAAYRYNNEYAPANIPEIDINIEHMTATAASRKLRARYSFDSGFDLQKTMFVDPDNLLQEASVNQIRAEIDAELLNDMVQGATGGTVTWNKVAPFGVSYEDHKKSVVDAMTEGSSMIFAKTRRAEGNFVVAGKDFCDVVETLDAFQSSGVTNPFGPYFLGTLKKWKVYKNPFFADTRFLIGYKGASLLDAGYIYAPYIPIFSTQVIMLDDFMARRGFATSYAKKLVNANFFVTGTVTNVAP